MGGAEVIRPATADDADALEALFAQTMRLADWRPPGDVGTFASASAGESVWVSIEQDQVIGLISVWVPDRFIHHLYVRPDAQRRGVGRALLASLDAWLPRPWRLKCTLANVKARAFYESNGWREVSRGRSEEGDYALLEIGPRQTE